MNPMPVPAPAEDGGLCLGRGRRRGGGAGLLVAAALLAVFFGGCRRESQAVIASRQLGFPGDSTWQADSIATSVEHALVGDPVVPSDTIDVQVDDGVVILNGSVPTLLAKRRAVRLAQVVRGVESVIDQLEVVLSMPRPDEVVARSVSQSLDEASPALAALSVEVTDGRVVISGKLDSRPQREWAKRIAASVVGVRELEPRIELNPQTQRTDGEIQRDVERALRWNAFVDADPIEAKVEHGRVRLSGRVGSLAERVEAGRLARVPGVREVDTSDLKVRFWLGRESRRPLPVEGIEAGEVLRALRLALRLDPRVDDDAIELHVDDRLVTLRGRVNTLAAKRAAGQDSRNTVGVDRVRNLVKVRPQAVDGETQRRVRIEQAMRSDAILSSADVRVQVHGPRVVLSGLVGNTFEKARADRVAARFPGVVRVDNDLVVADLRSPFRPDPYVDGWSLQAFGWQADPRPLRLLDQNGDDRIRRDIFRELQFSPYVDASAIEVQVDQGVATLRGRVRSELEKRAAQTNAIEGGATKVNNDLEVREAPPAQVERH